MVSGLSCGGLADVADELALGTLTGRERAQALAHLDICEACREVIRRRMAVTDELPGLLPARDPRPGFEAAVMARIGLALPGHGPGRCGRLAAPWRWFRIGPGPLLAFSSGACRWT